MVSQEEIKSSLNSNPYLTAEIKNCLMELIEVFIKKFPEVSLDNLNERLKTLKMIRGSKFLINGTSRYNPVDNELFISLINIDNDVDCKHILMRELLNIITSKDDYTGFNKDSIFEALNIGYTEILSNYLVGNDGECEYEDEVIATNIMCLIVGEEKFRQAYFTNDVKLLMNEIY